MTNIVESSIKGLYKITRPTQRDDRGFFREVFHLDEVHAALGFAFQPLQMNHSQSKPGVLRGFHAEDWNKLVYITSGQIFTAIADIRPDSATFGQVESFTVDSVDPIAWFISRGLANSFLVLGDQCVNYVYLVDAYYNNQPTQAIAWNDPDLGVIWPNSHPQISQRDQQNITLRQLYPAKFAKP